jgi:hypothetical protein
MYFTRFLFSFFQHGLIFASYSFLVYISLFFKKHLLNIKRRVSTPCSWIIRVFRKLFRHLSRYGSLKFKGVNQVESGKVEPLFGFVFLDLAFYSINPYEKIFYTIQPVCSTHD